MKTVADRLREKRIELGLTQEELAHKLGYSSRVSVNKYENGRPMTLKRLEAFAKALGCTPTYLLGWEDGTPIVPEDVLRYGDLAANALTGSDEAPDPDAMHVSEDEIELIFAYRKASSTAKMQAYQILVKGAH